MRNFLLINETPDGGLSIGVNNKIDVETLDVGNLALIGTEQINDNGTIKYTCFNTSNAADFKRGNLLYVRGDAGANKKDNEQTVVIPIFRHHLSGSVMSYKPATTFGAQVKINDPDDNGAYTIIIVKKGKGFNERNKYSYDTYVHNYNNIDAQGLANKLAIAINNGNAYSNNGVTATVNVSGSNVYLNIVATEAGKGYGIEGADNLMYISLDKSSYITALANYTLTPETALADDAMIIDMANKAAADCGFINTYQDDASSMYPNYPINRGNGNFSHANGFDVITLRFAEPREMRTRDDIVHQIVQIAIPRKEEDGTNAFAQAVVSLFKAIAGDENWSGEIEAVNPSNDNEGEGGGE